MIEIINFEKDLSNDEEIGARLVACPSEGCLSYRQVGVLNNGPSDLPAEFEQYGANRNTGTATKMRCRHTEIRKLFGIQKTGHHGEYRACMPASTLESVSTGHQLRQPLGTEIRADCKQPINLVPSCPTSCRRANTKSSTAVIISLAL
jgi:hypothetical protein